MAREGGTGLALAQARGVGIFLVVLYHADIALKFRLPTYRPFLDVVENFQYLAVPIFLVSAGLAMAPKLRSSASLVASGVNYLYVYLLWTAISLVVTTIAVQDNVGLPGTPLALLKVIVLPASPLWFPYGLGLMLFGAACLRRLNRHAVLLIAVAAGFVPFLPGLNKLAVIAICSNAAVFFFALRFRLEILRLLQLRARRTMIVATSVYLLLLLGSRELGLLRIPLVYDVLSVLGFFAVVSIWRLVPRSPVGEVAAVLGRSALPILLMHDFWLHAGLLALLRTHLAGLRGGAEFVLPITLTAVALGGTVATSQLLGRSSGLFVAPSRLRNAAATLAGRISAMRALIVSLAPLRAPERLAVARRMS